MILSRPLRLFICSCALFAAGCQKYSPSPLDLNTHERALHARHPSSADVVAYARQLTLKSPVSVGAYDPSDGLSVEEGEAVALFFNPELRTARLKAQVPAAGAAEAGRWEDTELRVDAERIIESVEHPWVIGGILNLTLPLSGRLKAEKEKALAEASVEQLRVVADEQRLLADLRVAWVEWSATVEQVELTRTLLNELDEILQTAEKLRAAGELDPLDARLFRIERTTQAGRLQVYEAQARSEELGLKSLLGLAPGARIRLLPSLAPSGTVPVPTHEARAWIARHPRVRVARAEYEVSERTLAMEIRKQYPDLTIGGGFGTDQGDDRVLGGIGLPLPLLNANRRAIAEARATREAARAAAEGVYERLLAEVSKAREALEAAAARLRFVETELAPLVDEQLTAARRLGRLGNYNTLVLLEAVKSAFDAKFEVLQARLRFGVATVRLNALVEPGSSASDDALGTKTTPHADTRKDEQP
jgi:outer membrane protein, heavy metal efflux system